MGSPISLRRSINWLAAHVAEAWVLLSDEGSVLWARWVEVRLYPELSLAKAVVRAYEERTGIGYWPLRHPLWFTDAFLAVRREVRQQTERRDRVRAAHERRLADYRTRGVPEDLALCWAYERWGRDLRRIGEVHFAAMLAEWVTRHRIAAQHERADQAFRVTIEDRNAPSVT